jgi:hypothetical protein
VLGDLVVDCGLDWFPHATRARAATHASAAGFQIDDMMVSYPV